GGTPLPGSPAQFGKLIAEETEKWGNVIRAANIKAERSARPPAKYSVTSVPRMSDARPRGRRRPYDADRPPRKRATAHQRPSSRPVCRNVTVTASYSPSVAESAYGA